MDTQLAIWIAVAVGVLIILALIGWGVARARRRRRLRDRFGPEYERTMERADSKREAERDLAERESHREELDIRPLSDAARRRYLDRWESLQHDFVDSPRSTVERADELVAQVMRERGYPDDGFERRAADLSVDHPGLVERYRRAHRALGGTQDGNTEALRRAMLDYRSVFETVVGEPEDRAGETREARTEQRSDERSVSERGDEARPHERTG